MTAQPKFLSYEEIKLKFDRFFSLLFLYSYRVKLLLPPPWIKMKMMIEKKHRKWTGEATGWCYQKMGMSGKSMAKNSSKTSENSGAISSAKIAAAWPRNEPSGAPQTQLTFGLCMMGFTITPTVDLPHPQQFNLGEAPPMLHQMPISITC